MGLFSITQSEFVVTNVLELTAPPSFRSSIQLCYQRQVLNPHLLLAAAVSFPQQVERCTAELNTKPFSAECFVEVKPLIAAWATEIMKGIAVALQGLEWSRSKRSH